MGIGPQLFLLYYYKKLSRALENLISALVVRQGD